MKNIKLAVAFSLLIALNGCGDPPPAEISPMPSPLLTRETLAKMRAGLELMRSALDRYETCSIKSGAENCLAEAREANAVHVETD